jgi:predicted MPP superfamily phosphohydrolase
MAAGERTFQIAHISDLHCGGPYFLPSLMERAIGEINDMAPDLVICTGDLTTFGFKQEFVQAKGYLDRIECEAFVVVPGTTTRATSATCISRSCSATATRSSPRTA